MKWTQCTRGFFTFSDDNTHLTLLFLAMFPCFKKKRRVLSFLYRTFIVSPFSRNAEAGRELGKHRTCAEALTALKCALKSNRKQKTEKKIRLLFFFFSPSFFFNRTKEFHGYKATLKGNAKNTKKKTHTHTYIYIYNITWKDKLSSTHRLFLFKREGFTQNNNDCLVFNGLRPL